MSSTKKVDPFLAFYLHREYLANPHKMSPLWKQPTLQNNLSHTKSPSSQNRVSFCWCCQNRRKGLSKPTEITSLSCQCFSMCRRKDSLVAHRDLAVSMCAFYSWWSPTSLVTLGELSNFSTHQNVCLLYNIIQFCPLMEIPLENLIAWNRWEAV